MFVCLLAPRPARGNAKEEKLAGREEGGWDSVRSHAHCLCQWGKSTYMFDSDALKAGP